MKSITVKELKFKDIERNFFEIGCEYAKMLMKEYLESLDKELTERRDKSELRHKGKRKTAIKTLIGSLTVEQ